MNLKFKSSEPDLKFNIQSQLRQINQNILYQTRQSDAILRRVDMLINSNKLQKQVDDYYDPPSTQGLDEDSEDIPEKKS